jgi:hypothetical protein
MKNVKYEGFYPCMHNHSTESALISRRKIDGSALYFSMDEEMERRSGR